MVWRCLRDPMIYPVLIDHRLVTDRRTDRQTATGPQQIPILLYALEVCNLDKRSLQSLDFTVNSFFMKLFQTSNIEIVHYCQNMSGLQLPRVLLGSRYQKFLSNMPCHVYT